LKIKILIAYHKLDWVLEDEINTPIHVGRAIFHQKSKDGIIKKEDEDKILSLMIGDETGENISKENRITSRIFRTFFWGLARSSSPLPEIRSSWEAFAHPRSGCLPWFLVIMA